LSQEQEFGIDWLRAELDAIVASYQAPLERRKGYGNLRHEYSTWRREGEDIVNIAIIYETPGGSTTQLNVTYSNLDHLFTYLDGNLGDQIQTPDPRLALKVIGEHVAQIPAKRQAALDQQVEAWMGEGRSKREVFAELNKLLQNEFLGGRVTTNELKAAIQHAIKLKTAADPSA
jgi:hypothetical protein